MNQNNYTSTPPLQFSSNRGIQRINFVQNTQNSNNSNNTNYVNK